MTLSLRKTLNGTAPRKSVDYVAFIIIVARFAQFMSATFSCFSDQKDSICMFTIKFHSVSLAVTRVRSRSREHESRIKVIQKYTDLDSMLLSLGSRMKCSIDNGLDSIS